MTTDTIEKIELLDCHPDLGDMRSELLEGLTAEQKTFSPKYFYDEAGSKLFDQITEQPEYYPTDTELAIMQRHVGEIARLIGPRASLIELGSGSSMKTAILLDHLADLAAYVPVDISREHLLAAARRTKSRWPHIDVRPVCADFTMPFDLPQPETTPDRNVVYFPGSTIGNFYPDQALALLMVMAGQAREGGALLIGVDLKKDKRVLEDAYNDAEGVTARFNLNALVRINRDLGADFDLERFSHRAIYNEPMGRIEMHLVSEVAQTVRVDGTSIEFEAGEYILSECSHKYAPEEFTSLARAAGFRPGKVWIDESELFSVHYLTR